MPWWGWLILVVAVLWFVGGAVMYSVKLKVGDSSPSC